MSGRTFTYTTGFDSFVKTLMPEVEAPVRRKAGGVGDGMLRDVEEFINRFCVTAANDDGDLTFDAAGTYTFDGDLVVNGITTLNGDTTVNGDVTVEASLGGGLTLNTSVGSQVRSWLSTHNAGWFFAPSTTGYDEGEVGIIPSNRTAANEFWSLVLRSPAYDTASRAYAEITLNGEAENAATAEYIGLNAGSWDAYVGGVNGVSVTYLGTLCMSFNTGRNMILPYQLRGASGSAGTPSFSFSSDTNTGMYRYGTDEIGFSTGGTSRFQIQSSNVYVPTAGGSYVANSPPTTSGTPAEWGTVFGVQVLRNNTSTDVGKRKVQTDLEGWLTPDMVDQVVPKMWTRDHAPDFPEIGPMAEEMDAISPFLGVHGTDKDGNQILTGIDRNSYLSLLVLAVKDLRQRIHLLEAQSNRPV